MRLQPLLVLNAHARQLRLELRCTHDARARGSGLRQIPTPSAAARHATEPARTKHGTRAQGRGGGGHTLLRAVGDVLLGALPANVARELRAQNASLLFGRFVATACIDAGGGAVCVST